MPLLECHVNNEGKRRSVEWSPAAKRRKMFDSKSRSQDVVQPTDDISQKRAATSIVVCIDDDDGRASEDDVFLTDVIWCEDVSPKREHKVIMARPRIAKKTAAMCNDGKDAVKSASVVYDHGFALFPPVTTVNAFALKNEKEELRRRREDHEENGELDELRRLREERKRWQRERDELEKRHEASEKELLLAKLAAEEKRELDLRLRELERAAHESKETEQILREEKESAVRDVTTKAARRVAEKESLLSEERNKSARLESSRAKKDQELKLKNKEARALHDELLAERARRAELERLEIEHCEARNPTPRSPEKGGHGQEIHQQEDMAQHLFAVPVPSSSSLTPLPRPRGAGSARSPGNYSTNHRIAPLARPSAPQHANAHRTNGETLHLPVVASPHCHMKTQIIDLRSPRSTASPSSFPTTPSGHTGALTIGERKELAEWIRAAAPIMEEFRLDFAAAIGQSVTGPINLKNVPVERHRPLYELMKNVHAQMTERRENARVKAAQAKAAQAKAAQTKAAQMKAAQAKTAQTKAAQKKAAQAKASQTKAAQAKAAQAKAAQTKAAQTKATQTKAAQTKAAQTKAAQAKAARTKAAQAKTAQLEAAQGKRPLPVASSMPRLSLSSAPCSSNPTTKTQSRKLSSGQNTGKDASTKKGSVPTCSITLGIRRDHVVRVHDNWVLQCNRILDAFHGATVTESKKTSPILPFFWNPVRSPDYERYCELIAPRQPMYFELVQDNLRSGKYDGPMDFCTDVNVVFQDILLYANTEGKSQAVELKKHFDQLYLRLCQIQKAKSGRVLSREDRRKQATIGGTCSHADGAPPSRKRDRGEDEQRNDMQGQLAAAMSTECIVLYNELNAGAQDRVLDAFRKEITIYANGAMNLDIKELLPKRQWDLYYAVQDEYNEQLSAKRARVGHVSGIPSARDMCIIPPLPPRTPKLSFSMADYADEVLQRLEDVDICAPPYPSSVSTTAPPTSSPMRSPS